MDKIKNSVFFLIYLLLNPRHFFKAVRGIYLPVFVQYEWLKNYKINTVVDVGASVGNVSHALHNLFPKAKIYAFDPIESSCNEINKKSFSNQMVIEKVAISNKEGESLFYKTNYLPTSSLLPLEKKYQAKFPLKEKLKVRVTTLDKYFKNIPVKKEVFLKIDTQGAELQVLQGGIEFLKKVSIIQIETIFDDYYLGQYLFQDIYGFLIKLGFVYKGSIIDAEFYPKLVLKLEENSIFINKKLFNNAKQ